MAENQREVKNLNPRSGGFFQDLANRARLVGRLVVDPRISPLIKILPVGTLLYVVFPDLLPFNPIDDAFVVWLGTSLFVQLCPDDIVQEHIRRLAAGGISSGFGVKQPSAAEEVIDVEYYEQTTSQNNKR
jgi:hypothetical protein